MKYLKLFILTLCMTLSATVFAQENGTEDEAKKMVAEALAHVKAVGAEQAFKDFSTLTNAKWHNKDVYLFCYKMDGTNTCHGANNALIGKNLFEMKTPDGQLLIKNMSEITKAKGSGWIDYQWPHPETKKIVPKRAWVMKIPSYDGFLGAGVYSK